MRDVRASGQGQGEEVKCESHGQVEGRRCKPTAAAHFVNARTACSRVQAIADVWAWISTDLHLSRLTERRDWFGAVRVFCSEEGRSRDFWILLHQKSKKRQTSGRETFLLERPTLSFSPSKPHPRSLLRHLLRHRSHRFGSRIARHSHQYRITQAKVPFKALQRLRIARWRIHTRSAKSLHTRIPSAWLQSTTLAH